MFNPVVLNRFNIHHYCYSIELNEKKLIIKYKVVSPTNIIQSLVEFFDRKNGDDFHENINKFGKERIQKIIIILLIISHNYYSFHFILV